MIGPPNGLAGWAVDKKIKARHFHGRALVFNPLCNLRDGLTLLRQRLG